MPPVLRNSSQRKMPSWKSNAHAFFVLFCFVQRLVQFLFASLRPLLLVRFLFLLFVIFPSHIYSPSVYWLSLIYMRVCACGHTARLQSEVVSLKRRVKANAAAVASAVALKEQCNELKGRVARESDLTEEMHRTKDKLEGKTALVTRLRQEVEEGGPVQVCLSVVSQGVCSPVTSSRNTPATKNSYKSRREF